MNLYLLTQDEYDSYDTYDSVVVAAASVEDARRITPDGRAFGTYDSWASSPDNVRVTWIGLALPSQQAGVILASFNAG